jgi:hypothetical protein
VGVIITRLIALDCLVVQNRLDAVYKAAKNELFVLIGVIWSRGTVWLIEEAGLVKPILPRKGISKESTRKDLVAQVCGSLVCNGSGGVRFDQLLYSPYGCEGGVLYQETDSAAAAAP